MTGSSSHTDDTEKNGKSRILLLMVAWREGLDGQEPKKNPASSVCFRIIRVKTNFPSLFCGGLRASGSGTTAS
jgi:hypothetical protein